jgi:hypothetical protein
MSKIAGWKRDQKGEGKVDMLVPEPGNEEYVIRRWEHREDGWPKGKPYVEVVKMDYASTTEYDVSIRAYRAEDTLVQFSVAEEGSLATYRRTYDTRKKATNFATRWMRKHEDALVSTND